MQTNNVSTTSTETKKSSKPIMEKRRRARINSSLSELKSLLMDVIRKEGTRHNKMEKADILELAVNHLKQIHQQQQQIDLAGSSDTATANKYRMGFNACAQEVSNFLVSVSTGDVELRSKLLNHLAGYLSEKGSEVTDSVHNEALQPTVAINTSATRLVSSPSDRTSPSNLSIFQTPVFDTPNALRVPVMGALNPIILRQDQTNVSVSTGVQGIDVTQDRQNTTTMTYAMPVSSSSIPNIASDDKSTAERTGDILRQCLIQNTYPPTSLSFPFVISALPQTTNVGIRSSTVSGQDSLFLKGVQTSGQEINNNTVPLHAILQNAPTNTMDLVSTQNSAQNLAFQNEAQNIAQFAIRGVNTALPLVQTLPNQTSEFPILQPMSQQDTKLSGVPILTTLPKGELALVFPSGTGSNSQIPQYNIVPILTAQPVVSQPQGLSNMPISILSQADVVKSNNTRPKEEQDVYQGNVPSLITKSPKLNVSDTQTSVNLKERSTFIGTKLSLNNSLTLIPQANQFSVSDTQSSVNLKEENSLSSVEQRLSSSSVLNLTSQSHQFSGHSTHFSIAPGGSLSSEIPMSSSSFQVQTSMHNPRVSQTATGSDIGNVSRTYVPSTNVEANDNSNSKLRDQIDSTKHSTEKANYVKDGNTSVAEYNALITRPPQASKRKMNESVFKDKAAAVDVVASKCQRLDVQEKTVENEQASMFSRKIGQQEVHSTYNSDTQTFTQEYSGIISVVENSVQNTPLGLKRLSQSEISQLQRAPTNPLHPFISNSETLLRPSPFMKSSDNQSPSTSANSSIIHTPPSSTTQVVPSCVSRRENHEESTSMEFITITADRELSDLNASDKLFLSVQNSGPSDVILQEAKSKLSQTSAASGNICKPIRVPPKKNLSSRQTYSHNTKQKSPPIGQQQPGNALETSAIAHMDSHTHSATIAHNSDHFRVPRRIQGQSTFTVNTNYDFNRPFSQNEPFDGFKQPMNKSPKPVLSGVQKDEAPISQASDDKDQASSIFRPWAHQ